MIIPSRWYAGGRGLDEFRSKMLHDRQIRVIHDYPNSVDCFPGVDIAGGICYFLWKRDEQGKCNVNTHRGGEIISVLERELLEKGIDTFIRHNQAIPILHKVLGYGEETFAKLVSPQTPFGIISSFKDYKVQSFKNSIKYYSYGIIGYIDGSNIKSNKQWINTYKVYLSAAYGERGEFPFFFLGKPFLGEHNSCCSQSYLLIGPLESENQSKHVISYIRTRFFRFMIMLKKNAQHNMRNVFMLVPLQDFSQSWTDEKPYTK
jgi:site-specific DNA-methyltransferase (adenine-specific)